MTAKAHWTRLCRTCVLVLVAAMLAAGFAAGITRPASATELYASDEGSSYDPRATEGTSAVRDQFWGTCWAMSGISSTESYLIHAGQESTDVQFSVEDVLWWVHESNWSMLRREDSGFPAMTTGYLSTVGVRSEADIPYFGKPSDFGDDDMKTMHPSNAYEMGENQRPANYDTAPVLYEITDIVFVKQPSQQEVKDLITTYGAVSAVYKMSDDYFDATHSTDWANNRYGEDGEELADSNHAVSVVGWSDSFPKEYFAEQNGKRPEHDGAWILKNSLGTGYGSEGGFTYVSYDDEYLFKGDSSGMGYCYAIAGARKPTGQKRYMHDTYGAVSSWQPAGSDTCTWANVFDFGSGERLNELSFVSWSKDGSYKLYYAPVSDGLPTSDESAWVMLAEGSIDHAGYATVASGWDAEVPAGKGAIVLKVTGDAPSIGTEQNLSTVRGAPLFNVNPETAKGTGYYLQDGAFAEASVTKTEYGEEVTEYPILSIRAYTVPYEKPADDGEGEDVPPSEDVTPAPADDGADQGQASGGSGAKANTGGTGARGTASRTTAKGGLPKTGEAGHELTAHLALVGMVLIALSSSWKLLLRMWKGESR